MIRRSFDAEEANRIINDPCVLPLIVAPGVQSLDITDIVANPANVLLMADGGVIFFEHRAPPEVFGYGVYDVHTAFLTESRGAHAIESSLEAYRWMFTHTDCMTIQTMVPAFNRPAAFAARKAGFEPRFERKESWPIKDGRCNVKYYELTYQRWLDISRQSLIKRGREFHDRLEREFERHGKTEKQHPDEDGHDLYVGACVETVHGGQPEKAVALYNKWAAWSGYSLLQIVSRSPLVINIGNAVLLIEGETFKVLKVA